MNEVEAVEQRSPQAANPFAVSLPKTQINAIAETDQQRAIAEVQAAMVIAQRFPRDPLVCMDKILQACTRPTLAESALYTYSRGGTDVTGPSIRLAEMLAQNWRNLQFGVRELESRHGESTVEAFAWDVETNVRQIKVFQVKHIRDTKRGSYKLEDQRDIYELVANQGARRLRACILGVIPGDVVEAAVDQCDVTLKTKAEVTPERLKGIVEKFAVFGVTKEMIEKRIQRHLDALTPALMVQLGKILNSLRDGMSAPADWFEVAATSDAAPATSAVDRVKAAVKAAKKPDQATAGTPPVAATSDSAPSNEAPKQEATAPVVSFAKLVDRMQKATDIDVLDADGDLIKSLPEDQQSDARTIYKQRRGELEAKA